MMGFLNGGMEVEEEKKENKEPLININYFDTDKLSKAMKYQSDNDLEIIQTKVKLDNKKENQKAVYTALEIKQQMQNRNFLYLFGIAFLVVTLIKSKGKRK